MTKLLEGNFLPAPMGEPWPAESLGWLLGCCVYKSFMESEGFSWSL